MKNIRFFLMILLSLQLPSLAQTQIRIKDWCFCVEMVSAPSIGFFPLGGAKLENLNMSSYIAGTTVDLYTIDFLGYGDENYQERFSPFNFTTFLFGFNLITEGSQTQKPSSLLQQAYMRFGPKYRFNGFGKNGSFALGTQIGYGILLQGGGENAHSRFQHGIDISFSFSWTPFRKNR